LSDAGAGTHPGAIELFPLAHHSGLVQAPLADAGGKSRGIGRACQGAALKLFGRGRAACGNALSAQV